jgi:hypothetical protein
MTTIVEQLRATENEATPGPWHFLEAGNTESELNEGNPLTICGPDDDDLANVYSEDDATVSIPRAEAIANATLIAVARTHMPALLAIVDAAKEYREAATALLSKTALDLDSEAWMAAVKRDAAAAVALDAAIAALTQETSDANT